METYQEFLNRINAFEKCDLGLGNEDFYPDYHIVKKVNRDNTFRPFYGDTVVFDLNESTKNKLSEWLDKLYQNVPECFCERLNKSTFHMTLHDLHSAGDIREIGFGVIEDQLKISKEREKIKAFDTIKMHSKYIFNMVDTSLVLGLYPADEAEYAKLMELYHVFDEVKKLDYPLTPHITLAYYNVNGFDAESARKLETLVCEWNTSELAEPMEVELNSNKLFYQRFGSMNDYENVIAICG